uniref:Ovule protein n=1 Tax=Ascaris lumbricoides TaxID=6252 RepID=A0A0M3IMM0_ASCLU
MRQRQLFSRLRGRITYRMMYRRICHSKHTAINSCRKIFIFMQKLSFVRWEAIYLKRSFIFNTHSSMRQRQLFSRLRRRITYRMMHKRICHSKHTAINSCRKIFICMQKLSFVRWEAIYLKRCRTSVSLNQGIHKPLEKDISLKINQRTIQEEARRE